MKNNKNDVQIKQSDSRANNLSKENENQKANSNNRHVPTPGLRFPQRSEQSRKNYPGKRLNIPPEEENK